MPHLAQKSCNPGVVVVRAEGQILDVGEDRRQPHARTVFGRDHQAARAQPAQTRKLRQRWIERRSHQRMRRVGRIAALAQIVRDFVRREAQVAINLHHRLLARHTWGSVNADFVHLHRQHNGVEMQNRLALENPLFRHMRVSDAAYADGFGVGFQFSQESIWHAGFGLRGILAQGQHRRPHPHHDARHNGR